MALLAVGALGVALLHAARGGEETGGSVATAGATAAADRDGTPTARPEAGKLNVVPTEPAAPPPAYGPGLVYVLTLSDEDNPGEPLGPFTAWNVGHIRRHLKFAEDGGASLFIVKLTTNGGRVDNVQAMSEALRSVRKMRTATFVIHRAISAGAIFSLSCDDIYMTPGSVIGDSYPIAIPLIPGMKREAEPAEENRPETAPTTKPAEGTEQKKAKPPRSNEQKKQVGGLADYIAEAARQKGHSPALAAAMVDPDISVLAVSHDRVTEIMTGGEYDARYPSAARAGHIVEVIDNDEDILMLGSRDAVKWGLARYEADGLGDILEREGLAGRPVVEVKLNLSERMARFFSSSIVVALLIAASILALYVELNHPSGVAGGFFLLALGLFFWANYMAGTANAFSIILVLLGAGLLAVEIFLIPGFGVTGIVGAVLVATGLVVARIPPDFFSSPSPVRESAPVRWSELGGAATPVLAGLGLGAIAVAILMRLFPRLPFLNRLMLTSDLSGAVVTAAQGAGVERPEQLVGCMGVAATVLRPGGSARFDGRLLDVVSDSEFIEAGARVRIVAADSNRIVVRRA